MFAKLLVQLSLPLVVLGADLDSLLTAAAQAGERSTVVRLISEGARADAKDQLGRTALMTAAYLGHADVVEVLIANRANVNMQDKYGVTALMLSGRSKQSVLALTSAGANLGLRDAIGWSALKWLSLSSDLSREGNDAFHALVAAHMPPNARGDSRRYEQYLEKLWLEDERSESEWIRQHQGDAVAAGILNEMRASARREAEASEAAGGSAQQQMAAARQPVQTAAEGKGERERQLQAEAVERKLQEQIAGQNQDCARILPAGGSDISKAQEAIRLTIQNLDPTRLELRNYWISVSLQFFDFATNEPLGNVYRVNENGAFGTFPGVSNPTESQGYLLTFAERWGGRAYDCVRFRNGRVGRPASRVYVHEGTEAIVAGIQYVYKSGQWRPVDGK